MNYLSVYNLHSGKLATKMADFVLPFELVKSHFSQMGAWTDSHSIPGFDGYAVLNQCLYGFRIAERPASG